MAIYVGIGFSQNPNTSKAAHDAALQAHIQIQESKVDFALVFSTIHYNPQETLMSVRQTLSNPKILGCSSAGIILSELIEMRGIAVLVINSDDMFFGTSCITEIMTQDPREAGNMLARGAITDLGSSQKRQAFICFADGLLKNTGPIIKGLQEILGTVFPIVGAGSSDDFHFKKTYQYSNDKVISGGAAGLLLSGPFRFAIGSKHGWKPLGKPRIVDKVDGHIIKTIDGKRASNLYVEYFGEDAEDLRSAQLSRMAILYPLGIYIPEEKAYILRNAIDILNDGSIVCQGEVPEGAEVHLMIGNKDSCKQAAVEAAIQIREALLGKEPKLIIIFESLARHKLLGRSAFKEIQLIQDTLGSDVPMIGMYSFGEITPFHSSNHVKKTHLQNESIVILGIGC